MQHKGVQDSDTSLWVSDGSASAWAQVANTGPAGNKNGDYKIAITHDGANTNKYLASFHCEKIAVGAAPAPDSSVGIHTGTGVTINNGRVLDLTVPDHDFKQLINE